MEIYPLMTSLSKIIYPIRLGSFLISQAIEWSLKTLHRMYSLNYTLISKFRFESKFSTYLYRVKLNAANSWLKRNKWKNILHLDQAPDKGERDTELEQEWTRKELWDAVAKLPNKQRKVVIMRIAKEMPYKEISEVTGMPEGTAKVNFHHAVRSLKEWLNND